MTKHQRSSYFSVAFDLIVKNKELPFDLYINSSSKEGRDRFVRIFPANEYLEIADLKEFKKKYIQLYILEEDRDLYLKSLVDCTDAPDVKKAEIIKDSAIHYLGKVFDKDKEFTTEVLEDAIEGCRESVESMIDVVQDYDIAKLSDLIGELSFHDFYTFDHSINVSMYSISIYKALNPLAKREEITMAGLGGLLHDLGKIQIPNSIINNPGDLSEEDFMMIKKHPDFGYEMLGDKELKTDEGVDINVVRRVVHEHHENFNGTGYPNKLKENEIHILARVTATADFFDAITTKRSYHEVLSVEDVAGLVPDDLRGYTEVKNGEKVHEDGILEEFKLSEENATSLIMRARVKAGWIDESDLVVPEEDIKEEVLTASSELTAEDVFG